MSSSPRTSGWKWVLPIVVLIAGAGATAALLSSKTPPAPQERTFPGALVETLEVRTETLDLKIAGQGQVTPKTQVDLLPEVAGRVVKVHSRLVTGGRIAAGQTLVEIDPRDYELRVERARAAVARAEVVLERESAEAEAARDEWRQVHGDAEAPSLLVREPQIRQAQAEAAAAQADLAAAELALERTRVSLPFDILVMQENVDEGQWVSQNRPLATVVGTDAVEIRVPLDDSQLQWLPEFDWTRPGAKNAPAAEVHVDFAGRKQTRQAQVDRVEGQVDARSRMVHVVVRVDDPFRPSEDGSASSPLMPGTFAHVEILGKTLENVVSVPRGTLRGEDRLWVMEDDLLKIRRVNVIHQSRDRAYLASGDGIESGEKVITSALEGAAEGLKVRELSTGSDAAPEDSGAENAS